MNANQMTRFTLISLLWMISKRARGGMFKYQREWGGLVTRVDEETADCSNGSRITHRYTSDFQEFPQHSKAYQETKGIGAASNPYIE